jgi:hypothetical protein
MKENPFLVKDLKYRPSLFAGSVELARDCPVVVHWRSGGASVQSFIKPKCALLESFKARSVERFLCPERTFRTSD